MRQQSVLVPLALLAAGMLCAPSTAQVDPSGRSVLFIRGADGSGGLGNGSVTRRTLHLSDINDTRGSGNTGFGEFAALLRSSGYTVSQWIESNGTLDAARLRPHRIVVFGSNNRVYSQAEVQAFETWWRAGGSALFISDANWGSNWNVAAASDNQFLQLVGASVYQDSGDGVPLRARASSGHYLVPQHPIVSGPDGVGGRANSDVNSFNGEGVSWFNVTGKQGVRVEKVVSAIGRQVRLLNPSGGPGAKRASGPDDCGLFGATLGNGRIVGHFDRNTFFNKGGVGSDISQQDNARLALRIFEWLASVPASSRALANTGCGMPRVAELALGAPILGRSGNPSLRFAPPGAAAVLLVSPLRQSGNILPSCPIVPDLATAITVSRNTVDAQGSARFILALPYQLSLSSVKIYGQAILVHNSGTVLGALDLSNGVEGSLGWPY